MSEPTTFEVTTTDGLTLTGHTYGSADNPTVVLVHGYPDCSTVWSEVAPRLAATHHVVTYDVRGTGGSESPEGRRGYRLGQLADDLVAVADAVSPDEPVHVVGHDWGAIQAFEAATSATHAARLASFTCVSGASFDHAGRLLRSHLRPSTRPWRSLGAIADQATKSWYIYLFQLPFLPELIFRSGAGSRAVQRLESVEATADYPAPTFDRDATNGVNLYRANLHRVLRPQRDHVHVPTQIVVGDRDPFVSTDLFEELPELAPDAWLRVVRGGHWLPRSEPGMVARIISDFVGHVEGGEATPELRRSKLNRRDRRDWHGKVAVITGAGNGIGRATALHCAERGAAVAIVDLDLDAADRTATFVRHHGVDATVHRVDVSDAAAMEGLVKDVLATHGAPDLVVNNAGMGMAGDFLQTSADDWERIIGVNLWGVIHGSRLFAQAMVDDRRPGHIVNLSSALAYLPASRMSAYATTKAAVLMLSEVLRNEFAEHGIGVSAICPGIVDTGITDRTAFVDSTDEQELARRRSAATSLYQRRSYGPQGVARAIMSAVDDDRAIVPVTIESHVGRLVSRLMPGVNRRLARTELVPK